MRGMHEALDLHEVLDGKVCAIDHFALYESQAQDQELKSMLHRQINRMVQDYNNLVNMARGRGVELRTPPPTMTHTHADVNYGMQGGQPTQPQTNLRRLSDQAITQGMLLHHKCAATNSTTAALESADAELRQMMTNCAVTAINMAYETFQFMNSKGWYQVPTMDRRTMSQIGQSYQPVGMTPGGMTHGMTHGMGQNITTPGPTGNIANDTGFGGQFGNYTGKDTPDHLAGNRIEHISPENLKM